MTKQEALPARFFIGLLALATVVVQLVVVPRAGAAYAGRHPDVAYLEPLYVTALLVALISLGIALLSAWQLVSAALTHRASPYRRRTITWHNGATGGFSSWIGIDQEARIGVAVLSSRHGAVDRPGFRLLEELVASGSAVLD
jgi:CubicO group peptidase (beta-lactamase class C family)